MLASDGTRRVRVLLGIVDILWISKIFSVLQILRLQASDCYGIFPSSDGRSSNRINDAEQTPNKGHIMSISVSFNRADISAKLQSATIVLADIVKEQPQTPDTIRMHATRLRNAKQTVDTYRRLLGLRGNDSQFSPR